MRLVRPLALILSLLFLAGPALAQKKRANGPPLSQAALHSLFGQIRGVAPELDDMRQSALAEGTSGGAGSSQRINADYNLRPQDEPAIGILYGTSGLGARWVAGANDYGIGAPVGGGVYSSEGVNYFPPFPALAVGDGTGGVLFDEVPGGTGDPTIVSGLTRASPGIPAGRVVTYYGSLAFSRTFCNNGVQVARSFDNGASWNRTRVPNFGAFGFPAYWDNGFDCSVFHDKLWIAIDNTGGPHNGRLYVTWTRFLSDATGAYQESPIVMAYSDDNATTFSSPIVISGSSAAFCTSHANALSAPTDCNEDQNSTPVVLPNGDLAVSFENGNSGSPTFRGQMLVSVYSPATGLVRGPYQAAPVVYDGAFDYPISNGGSQTFCNSNFRNGVTGSLAADTAGNLYLAYSDDKKHAGEFVDAAGNNVFVGDASTGYACPAGLSTDTDVYVLSSRDGGRTWRDMSPKAGQAKGDQFWPWVVAGKDKVAVVFIDRSRDPGNKLVDATLAQWDPSARWRARRISKTSSNYDNAFFGAGSFAGDYINAAMDSSGTVHAVWTCVAPGKFDSDICMSQGDGESE